MLILTITVLASCQPKGVATSGTTADTGGTTTDTTDTTADPVTTTESTSCGHRSTEALTDFDSTGTIPEPPCGRDGCGPGEVCVVPGDVCELYDTESCDPDLGIDNPCGDREPGPPPYCAPVPPSCLDGSTCNTICLELELCESCGVTSLINGVLYCGAAFCHCP